MGTEIDRLEVQVEAQATKANNQLDKLVGKLDALSSSLSHLNSSGLTGLANGVSKFAQASSQLSNVKTTDFTRLTKNIDKIENLNTQQIYSASSAIVTLSNAVNSLGSVSANSMQVVNVANSIGKLGGASVQKAITNLPALATAMNDLMTTLSKAPAVSNNIIQMTRALADLASQGAKVGTAGTSLTKSVNGVGTAMSATTKKARSLSSALGSIYQKYFLLMRGASKLWDSIEGSMDYVEVLNYFDAAMQQVSANAGESSAEAYFESFSSRAKELTSKMTGFNVNDNGTLTATGNASLGINPTKLMNYQATFAQMSSSMGVASETSLLLSQALTEIGADLASVKNMDFDKVWKDMASGLAGMSRTLDKYGVNIRNVNLQQKLLDLGIEENITNLNQNDKALLRAIILLDSTKYAWGDLADTLEQPANQLRLLESNFANLSRTLGNLFLPVVSNVLPYVNGLVIGLQRLFTWVGNLLGIDLSGITSAVSDSAVDIGELLGETDDLTDSLTAAGNAAKKLKSNLQAFDELNVITTQTDSSSALSGVGLPSGLLDTAFEKSFSEYQKAWDEAFSNMENRANEFADKVEEYLQPVRDIIEDFAIGDYFKAGQDTSNLVAGIFNFFANAIDNVDWYEIGENIGEFLNGIEWDKVINSVGNFIKTGIDAAINLWEGAFSADPIATTIVTAIGIAKFTGLDKTLKNKIIEAFPTDITLSDTIALTLPIALFIKTSTQEGAEEYIESLEKINTFDFEDMEASDWLNAILGFAGAGVGLNGEVFAKNTLSKDIFDSAPREEDFETLEEYNAALERWYKESERFMLDSFKIPGVEYDENGWNKSLIDLKDKISSWWNDSVITWWNDDIMPWLSEERWETLGQNIGNGISNKWKEFTLWWEDTGIPNWWDNNVMPWTSKEKWLQLGENIKGGLSDKWKMFTNWWKTTGLYKWWQYDVMPFFDKEAWSWSGIKEGLSESWNAAIEAVKNLWNNFANWLNDKLTWNIDPVSIAGKQIFDGATISLGKIPTFDIPGYALGGFPDISKPFAVGENGPELMGGMYGKTTVAPTDSITAGIEEAAYRGMMRALSESGGSNVTIQVEGDPSGMFRVWKKEYTHKADLAQKNLIPIF